MVGTKLRRTRFVCGVAAVLEVAVDGLDGSNRESGGGWGVIELDLERSR